MTMIEKNKEEFISLCKENIKRPGIDKLLDWLETTDFYKAPASTKYHGSYSGGLVEHCLNVYYSLKDELTFIYGSDKWQTRYSLETVTIVSLFHDLCKINRYVAGTRNVKDSKTGKWESVPTFLYNTDSLRMGHGSASVFYIMKHIILTEEEIQAIYWHMGAYDLGSYNTVGDLSESFCSNTLAFALHRADMLSTYIVENEKFEPLSYESNN